MIDKWKKAVIHLEGATDSSPTLGLTNPGRDIRFNGTALFFMRSGKRYLLTARHVLWDKTSAERIPDNPENKNNMIFNIIFRVPSLDEILNKQTLCENLMNLGAGASFTLPYTFSEPAIDLAVISLDHDPLFYTRFADELIMRGYVPVSFDDFAEGPTSEGQDVFTVGFPGAVSIVGLTQTHQTLSHWSSNAVSLPVASFGKVAMLHTKLPYFWTDISIYPGNSGGPVIANDRLIGIVSSQATIPLENVTGSTRIPFACIIKAQFVRDLLLQQDKKDKA